MSKDDFEIEEDDDGNKTVTIPYEQAKNQRDLARKATENEAAATERDAAQRKLAFYEAGINMQSDLAELFVNGYTGDVTADAIKEAAAKYPGLIVAADATTTTTTEGGEQLTPEQIEANRVEAEQTAARQQLANGGAPAGAVDVNPIDAANDTADRLRKQGGADALAQVGALNTLIGAAVAGDTRVLIDPRTGTHMGAA